MKGVEYIEDMMENKEKAWVIGYYDYQDLHQKLKKCLEEKSKEILLFEDRFAKGDISQLRFFTENYLIRDDALSLGRVDEQGIAEIREIDLRDLAIEVEVRILDDGGGGHEHE